jgi:hypothetical protein
MSIVDLATLRHLYVDQQLSIRAVAAALQIDPRTVHTALICGRIARRQRWEQRAIIMQHAAGGNSTKRHCGISTASSSFRSGRLPSASVPAPRRFTMR